MEWFWNKGILSYEEVKKLRGKIPTTEYNDLILKSAHYYTFWEFITLPFVRIKDSTKYSYLKIKTFFTNIIRFRKILCEYQGWDFSYDIDMLIKMYEIKIESFEIAIDVIEDGKDLLEEIKEIHKALLKVREADYSLDKEFIKIYKKAFDKMKTSYKFWW